MKRQPMPWRERGCVSRAEAMDITGLKAGKLDELLREGVIRSVRAGRRVLVSVSSLEAFVDGVTEHYPEPMPPRPELPPQVRRILADLRRWRASI